jgi:DNA-binding MarR family transcriptional regulator
MSEELRKITGGVDRLLHEPARLLIATILFNVEQVDFLFLLNETGLTKGNLSAHLAKLEAGGYVLIEKTYRGKIPQTLISLTQGGRAAFDIYRLNLEKIVDRLSEDRK